MTRFKYGGLIFCLAVAAVAVGMQPRARGFVETAPARAFGNALHVPADYATVQAAIDAAHDGDEIVLADGVYAGAGNCDLDFAGKGISLHSASDDRAACVIECANQSRAFIFRSGETAAATVRGLTMRNGAADAGAALYCDGNSNPTFINCTITGGFADQGGAVACWDSSPTLTNCVLESNAARYRGGALYCAGASPILTNCILRGNLAGSQGGAILCEAAALVLSNCLIIDNTAERYGGGIYCLNCSPGLTNCTMTDNAAGITAGALYCNESSVSLTNCIVWNNTLSAIYVASGSVLADYCDVQGGWPGAGNLDADPLFALAGDPHLLPGSPCVDAGIEPTGGLPAGDVEGVTRLLDGDADGESVVDMGACEFTTAAPTIAVSPAALTFSVPMGHRASQPLNIRNSSLGTLNWTLQSSANWLTTDVVAGQSSGEINVVTLTADASNLSYGQYEASVRVDDPNACNALVLVRVILTVHSMRVPQDYPTIQAAIDAALDGDEIVIANGTYRGDGNRNLDFRGKAISVRSASGDPTTCIIECEYAGRGFWFHSGETPAAVLDGVSIVDGICGLETPEIRGGGILCMNGSSPTISNCILRRCQSRGGETDTTDGTLAIPGGGGGLACLDHSSPILVDCTVGQCSVRLGQGAAVLCTGASCPSLERCTVTGCEMENATGPAGAVVCLDGSNARLTDCLIEQSGACAGLYCQASDAVLIDCTVAANSAEDCGGLICYSANPTLRGCNFTGNEGYFAGAVYCDHSSPVMHGCTFAENAGAYASAITCEWYSYPELTACRITAGTKFGSFDRAPPAIFCQGSAGPTLASCLIDDPRGLWAQSYSYPAVRNSTVTGPVISSYSSDTAFEGSIVWSTLRAYTLAGSPARLSLSYCDVQGGQAAVQVDYGSTLVWGGGNIDADPGFADPDGPDGSVESWQDNDYHLSVSSPCINAGRPDYVPSSDETDIDGQCRLWQGRIDIGADEFDAPGGGDLNCDGAVNVFDIDPFVLALTAPGDYAAQYPACARLLADLNGDGLVNVFDIDPFVLRLVGGQRDSGSN